MKVFSPSKKIADVGGLSNELGRVILSVISLPFTYLNIYHTFPETQTFPSQLSSSGVWRDGAFVHLLEVGRSTETAEFWCFRQDQVGGR